MMCGICPRRCLVDRKNNLGYCKMKNGMAVSKIMMHKWEEPFISGIEYGAKGTGAIFFYGCNLSCIYCQNYKISNEYKYISNCKEAIKYKIYTVDELSDKMLELQKEGAYTISLITPNIYIEDVVVTIKLAKKKGVTIPFVYNTSGYDSIESLKKLDGLIDIYMPDFKYFNDELGKKYSDVSNYVDVTKRAINEMYMQVGSINIGNYNADKNCIKVDKTNDRIINNNNAIVSVNKNNECGNIRRGMIVRHMVLPGKVDDSKKIIKYLYDTYGDNIYISIMNQYTYPKDLKRRIELSKNDKLTEDDILNLSRSLTKEEYDEVVDYALSLGVKNAFTQDEGTDSESFIPDFD